MVNVELFKREMTNAEFDRMKFGFDEHTLDNSVQIQESDRIGYVAEDNGTFIGCSSGLAYKSKDGYNGWFYLTDLFVEKNLRSVGLGTKLLSALEQEIIQLGIKNIWLWTAGYEAPGFYKKQGYQVFAEMANWYSDGSNRVGLKKSLG